jgi:hypothetical protein
VRLQFLTEKEGEKRPPEKDKKKRKLGKGGEVVVEEVRTRRGEESRACTSGQVCGCVL